MFRIVIPIILISVSVLLGVFNIKPVYITWVSLKKDLKVVNEDLQKIKDIEIAAEDLRKEIKNIPDSNKNKLNVVLPDEIDQIRFLNMVNSIASRKNLLLSGLEISEKSKNESSIGGAKANSNLETGAPNTMEVNFSVEATYDTFKEFLGDLESSLSLMDVESFSVSVPASSPDENEIKPYSYKVKLVTYLGK